VPDDFFPEHSIITRYDLDAGTSEIIWDGPLGGVAMTAIDASGERLYAIVERAEDDHGSLLYWENGVWNPLFAAPKDDEIYFLRPCGKGGALFLRSEIPEVEGLMPPAPDLFLVSPDGAMDMEPELLRQGEFPLSC
jgi:hypothetical protein